jgi:hypothetical protein
MWEACRLFTYMRTHHGNEEQDRPRPNQVFTPATIKFIHSQLPF